MGSCSRNGQYLPRRRRKTPRHFSADAFNLYALREIGPIRKLTVGKFFSRRPTMCRLSVPRRSIRNIMSWRERRDCPSDACLSDQIRYKSQLENSNRIYSRFIFCDKTRKNWRTQWKKCLFASKWILLQNITTLCSMYIHVFFDVG